MGYLVFKGTDLSQKYYLGLGFQREEREKERMGISRVFKLNGAETRTVGNPEIAGDGLSDASWACKLHLGCFRRVLLFFEVRQI